MNIAEQSLSFLNPDTIAIIGASTKPEKRGYQAIVRLQQDGFPASNIFPINPREKQILGLEAFTSVLEVNGKIDMALACTPAKSLPAIIAECGKKHIGCVVVLAAGFSESGEEGRLMEEAMLAAGRKWNVRIIGPNTNGIFNLHKNVNLVGVPDTIKGNIGLVSQSGNITLGFITEVARKGGTGFSTFIGVGNQADLEFSDYARYFKDDKNTSVAVMYVEGFKNGRRFLETARELTPQIPIVVFKSGRSSAGQSSAASHTGALACRYDLTRDVLRQAGVCVVEESDNVIPIAEALGGLPVARGRRIAILTDGGGHGTIVTDALVEAGLEIATLSNDTLRKLEHILPAGAQVKNPVDLAGATDENSKPGADCAKALLEDEGVDVVMIVGMLGGFHRRFSDTLLEGEVMAVDEIIKHYKTYNKPLIVQSVYTPLKPETLFPLRNAGIPVFIWAETAVSAVKAVVEYGHSLQRLGATLPSREKSPVPGADGIMKRAFSNGRNSLLENEARELLRIYGVNVPCEKILSSALEVNELPDSFKDHPMALKIMSPDILHKSEAGGVKINIQGEEGLKVAYSEIIKNAKTYKTDARIEGVMITPMVTPGVEIILGVIRDVTFGPVLMFGLGGVFVEILKDVTFRSIPLSVVDAKEMIEDIKAVDILNGARGQKAINRDALVQVIMCVSDIITRHPEIVELDLNPVIVNHEGVAIVDARIILES